MPAGGQSPWTPEQIRASGLSGCQWPCLRPSAHTSAGRAGSLRINSRSTSASGRGRCGRPPGRPETGSAARRGSGMSGTGGASRTGPPEPPGTGRCADRWAGAGAAGVAGAPGALSTASSASRAGARTTTEAAPGPPRGSWRGGTPAAGAAAGCTGPGLTFTQPETAETAQATPSSSVVVVRVGCTRATLLCEDPVAKTRGRYSPRTGDGPTRRPGPGASRAGSSEKQEGTD